VDRVYSHREAALAATFDAVVDSSNSALLAEMTLAVSLGLHTWHPPFSPDLTCRVVTDWMRRIVGLDAEICTESGVPTLALRRT